jgi:hypothetical protein
MVFRVAHSESSDDTTRRSTSPSADPGRGCLLLQFHTFTFSTSCLYVSYELRNRNALLDPSTLQLTPVLIRKFVSLGRANMIKHAPLF